MTANLGRANIEKKGSFVHSFKGITYEYDRDNRILKRNNVPLEFEMLPRFQFRLTFEHFCERYETEHFK